jgi:hypothetical protein
MSPFLYGPSGELVAKDHGLVVIRQFEYRKTHWAIGYSLLSISRVNDVASIINNEIALSKGDGMINLTITAKHSPINSIPLSILPIWPGATVLEVKGDIVKLTNQH